MINALEELLSILERNKCTIKCATIRSGRDWWEEAEKRDNNLKEGHTPEEYQDFLHKLDYEYDNGYGGQELYGTIWLMKPNTWLTRGEYDGSEWWEYNECPAVPEELRREDSHFASTL